MTNSRAGRIALAATFIILATIMPPAGDVSSAVPLVTTTERTAANEPYVSLEKHAVAVSVEGTFAAGVRVIIDRPTGYLESRLQIHRPSGQLIFQKTEVRNEVTTGTVTIGYERALSDLELRPGAYPITLRVRSDAGGDVREWNVEDELLVFDPDSPPTQLVLIARLSSAPLVDPQGRFVVDPAHASYAREQADALAALVIARKDLRVSLALPPVLAEEWLRASQGYEIVDAGGVSSVGADGDYARGCAQTLQLLRTAIDTGRLELMNIPYADPDLEGLLAIGHIDDLSAHYEQGLSAYLAALETSPSASTIMAGYAMPASATGLLAQRSIATAVLGRASLVETDTPATFGTLAAGVSGLVVDGDATRALRSGETTTFVHAVFSRQVSEQPTMPIVAVAEIGPGSPCGVDCLETSVSDLAGAPWVDIATVAEAGTDRSPAEDLALVAQADTGADAPDDYWPAVRAARQGAEALEAAAGPADTDARTAATASLIGESRMWAGFDGTWSLADRGRAYTALAERIANAQLSGLAVAASDITLSGARGSVPVQVINPSNKTLSLTLHIFPERLAVVGETSIPLSLRPSDNFLTIPVDLQSSLSGTLRIELRAGDLLLDETTVRVRASYLDRLALVGGITLVLAGMLWFIRRRVRGAEVGIIAEKTRTRPERRTSEGDS